MRCETRFTGRVQGVGFRQATSDVAHRLGLQGWVRNEADGSVLLVIEGSSEAIDECLGELRERMEGFITNATSSRFDDEHGYGGFEIRT